MNFNGIKKMMNYLLNPISTLSSFKEFKEFLTKDLNTGFDESKNLFKNLPKDEVDKNKKKLKDKLRTRVVGIIPDIGKNYLLTQGLIEGARKLYGLDTVKIGLVN